MRLLTYILLPLIWTIMLTASAYAQNVGGVFPPMVNEEHKSLQYRIAINPDNSQSEFGYAQRLHYQQAINEDFMWRVIGQTKKTNASDFDFDFIGAELFWELSDDESKHKTGFRFDARFRDDNRSEVFGAHWMNQFNLENGWHLRTVAMSFVQSGDNAAKGVNLQTRAQLAKRLEKGPTLGVELYNNYGNTGSIGSFKDQSHTFGPFISYPLGDGVSVFGGPLIGLSKAAPDLEARLWVTKGF